MSEVTSQTQDNEGNDLFVFSDGKTVFVNSYLVGFTDGHPSNVDYYYEERGYGCETARDVAIQYHRNFAN